MKNMIGRTISNGLKAFMVLVVFLAILLAVQVTSTQILYGRVILKAYTVKTDEPKRTEAETRQKRIYESGIQYLPDGTLHLRYPPRSSIGQVSPDEKVEIYDVNDCIVWAGIATDNPFLYLREAERFNLHRRQELDMFQHTDPDFSRDLVFPVADAEGKKTELWRYDFNKCYFTGYDRRKRIIGYCSAAGFTDKKEAIVPFQPLQDISAWIPWSFRSPQAFLFTERQIWQVNFETRRLEKLYESQTSKISGIETIAWRQLYSWDIDSRPALLIHIKNQPPVLILKEPRRVLTIQRPESLSEDYFHLYSSGNSFYVVAGWIQGAPDPHTDFREYMKWREENRYKSWTHWQELYRIEEDGMLTLLNHFEYTRPPYSPSASQVILEEKAEQMREYTSFLAPACFSWLHAWIHRWFENRTEPVSGDSLMQGLAMLMDETRPRGPWFYYPISLILAAAALVHSLPRRTGWGRIIGWLIFIFCFNLAGFLTYLSLNHFPVIRCASCGRKRGLNRPDCASCGAGLPSPESRDVDLIYPPSGETATA